MLAFCWFYRNYHDTITSVLLAVETGEMQLDYSMELLVWTRLICLCYTLHVTHIGNGLYFFNFYCLDKLVKNISATTNKRQFEEDRHLEATDKVALFKLQSKLSHKVK